MRVLWAGLIATLLGIAGCAPRNGPALVRPLSFPEPSYANLDDATHQALRQAWDAAQKNSTDSATVARFGMMLLSVRQPEAAVAPFAQASRLEPENFAWLYYGGVAQQQAGHAAEALETLKRALAKKSNFVPLEIRIADAMLAAGRVDEAQKACTTILMDHPNAPPVHRTLAGVYEKLGQTDKVEDEKKLAEAPVVDLPYLQDPWIAALNEMTKPLEAKPVDTAARQAHFEKGRDWLAKKKYPEAIAELKQTLVPEDRQTPGYLLTISIAYSQAGDSDAALESAQKAQQMAKDQSQPQLLPAIEAQLARLATDASEREAKGEKKPTADKRR